MTTNPFSATTFEPIKRGVFGTARLVRSGFLYRVIQIDAPVQCQLVYDGWWFRQRIQMNGEVVWFRISWLKIERRVEFRVPAAVDAAQSEAAIEIDFGPGLAIRRFRAWIDGQIVYDEIC